MQFYVTHRFTILIYFNFQFKLNSKASLTFYLYDALLKAVHSLKQIYLNYQSSISTIKLQIKTSGGDNFMQFFEYLCICISRELKAFES